ncbi:universal stress protein [Dyadobacter frigoris]|uniref:Universal stress protein n=1 Tax=Dyadobacter frigoris TaxID=2576211 RepID=A0A4U6D670_9BACT|nr:universal stress protein [Dyadobacter frigoris]TKT91731.1 universal stress protein [Dyadobacter frigoris]GLU51699.1 universal stress protein UspA [Dyadobacter frigoris]
MKRILVPYDFSPASEKAIKFAMELSDQVDELLLLNVINENNTSEKLAQELQAIELKFQNMMTAYPKTGVALHHKVLSGKFLPSILKVIDDEKIDLVVMGTHGSRGWDGFFMGSNIEKVVRTSPVPVFAVRGEANLKSIHDIVFPCNLKLDQPEILLKVKELQKLFHARLHLLHINTGKSLNEKMILKLEDYAIGYQLSNYKVTVVNGANIKDEILQFSREINADMIAMITHGKRELRHLFTESITADIVNHANILVWTCTS